MSLSYDDALPPVIARRSGAHPPDTSQSGGQRGEVHRAGHGARRGLAAGRRPSSRSASPTAASASPASSLSGCFSVSPRRIPRPRAAMAAPGLGSPSARRWSSSWAARIGAAAEPGSGSTFWITLPLIAARESRRESAASAPARSPADADRCVPTEPTRPASCRWQRSASRLLLVEDNFVNQRVAVYMLGKLGHQVDVAMHGREAIDMSEQGRATISCSWIARCPRWTASRRPASFATPPPRCWITPCRWSR